MVGKPRSDPKLARYFPKIVYVLSGGAAKGFCHVGMLEALEKRGIKPDLIVGTSAGSLIGALYSHFGNTADLVQRVGEIFSSEEFMSFERKYFGEREPLDSHVQRGIQHFLSGLSGAFRTKMHFGMSLVTSAMVSERDAAALFEEIFKGITIDTLKIPFASVAIDLTEGRPVVFTAGGGQERKDGSRTISGSSGLMTSVMASCAIPLVFPAVAIGDHAFADGSIMANLPVREARALFPDNAPFIAGFDVLPPVLQSEEKLSSVELALRLLDLATRSKQYADRELADVVFKPLNEDYPWSSFTNYERFIQLGKAYMTDARLENLERLLAEKCLEARRNDRHFLRTLLAATGLERDVRKDRSRNP